MPKLKTSAIIPLKTFSKAKTRLNLHQDCKEEICSLMLHEVLRTISNCNDVNQIVLVSKDENALKIGRKFNTIEIFDNESGVNNAIDLADEYISDKKFDCSIVFPQDIPAMVTSDVETLLNFIMLTDFIRKKVIFHMSLN